MEGETAVMEEAGHFIAGFSERMSVKMSKTAGSSMKFSPPNCYPSSTDCYHV